MMKRFSVFCLIAVLGLTAVAQGLLRRPRTTATDTATAAPAVTPPAAEAAPSDGDDGAAPPFNWDAAPLDIVFESYQEQTERTVLRDPGLPNVTINLKSRKGQSLTKDEWLEAIEVILEMNGIHLEPYGEKFVRALPRNKVRKEGIGLIMDPETQFGDSGRVVSVMIPFKNISTEEAQKALEGLKSETGVLNVFERTNSMLVTDTEQNINRMLEIVKAIDVASPVTENVFVRQIKNATATDIQTHLQKIVEESMKEQEKDGKAVQNAANQRQPQGGGGNRLLNRKEAPEAPKPIESIVTSISDADRGMIRGKVLILADERSNKLVIITQKTNMDFFDKVIEQLDVETTPDTVVKVYRLKYAEAEDVSDMINDLIGNAASSKNSSKQNQNQNARNGQGGNVTTGRNNNAAPKGPANQRTGEAKAGELSKENTTVLADKRINGLVVMTNKELVPVVEQIIESMDVKLSQVLIETVIIEVSLGDGLDTGIDWVQRGKARQTQQATDRLGNGRFDVYKYQYNDDGTLASGVKVGSASAAEFAAKYGDDDSFTLTEIPSLVTTTVRDGFVNHGNYMLGGGGGTGVSTLNTIMDAGTNVLGGAVWGGANPIGSGVNYFLKSDKLNLAAIIKASKTDSHTKYLASPIVMTVDNKEAVINATELQYLLKGFQTSGSSYFTMAVPDYEQKDIGIEIKVTPKINPNGTVMLTTELKYSQVSGSTTIQTPAGSSSSSVGSLIDVQVPITATREMSADVLLENMQTVIFGGLTDTYMSEEETGIPLLKDIPWIGKWLFGSVSQVERRKELLVFMTPYVLDDSDATQAEAIRRKKTLSDPRPWEDHGWSLSELADPIDKQEQLRRLKEEWKKQDEDRTTKLAIEKAKLERASKIREMGEEERKMWLKLHEKDLEEDQRKALEEKMLDEESQTELKALAERIRAEKMGEAQEVIDENDEAMHAENERGKYDQETVGE